MTQIAILERRGGTALALAIRAMNTIISDGVCSMVIPRRWRRPGLHRAIHHAGFRLETSASRVTRGAGAQHPTTGQTRPLLRCRGCSVTSRHRLQVQFRVLTWHSGFVRATVLAGCLALFSPSRRLQPLGEVSPGAHSRGAGTDPMILYVLDLGRPASLPPRRHGTGRTFDARKRISATRPATNYDL